jgi:hypothetical protein
MKDNEINYYTVYVCEEYANLLQLFDLLTPKKQKLALKFIKELLNESK